MIRAACYAMMVALTVSAGACDGDESTGPVENQQTATVNAGQSAVFSPRTVNIVTGGVVTWVFTWAHNVTFDETQPGAPANITSDTHQGISRTFGTAGVFNYHCTIHAGMTGVVRVGQ